MRAMAARDPRQPNAERRSLVRNPHLGVKSDVDLLGMVTRVVAELK